MLSFSNPHISASYDSISSTKESSIFSCKSIGIFVALAHTFLLLIHYLADDLPKACVIENLDSVVANFIR